MSMSWWLGGRGITQPVRAVTSPVTDGWCAEQPETGIWGAGKTEAGAIEDLRCALHEHRDVLMSTTDMSPHLRAQRQYLVTHLAPP